MSASQDKKKRTQQRTEGTERRQVASQKAAQEQKKSKTRWIVGSIIVVLLVAFIIVGNSNLFYTGQTAVKINGESVSVAEFNYEYMSIYSQYSQMYSQYAQYLGTDTTCAPEDAYTLDDDDGDAFATWDDFYKDAAIQSIARKQALCALADAEGVTLTDDEIQEIDDSLASLEPLAKEYGYASVNKMLSANYGSGVNKKIARKLMLRDALAEKYETEYEEALTFTDAELEAAYAEHKDEYDTFDFSYYFVAADTVTTTDDEGNETSAPTDETMAAAKETADQILAASAGDIDTISDRFAAAVAEFGAPESTYETDEDGNYVYDDDGKLATVETPAEVVESTGTQGSTLTMYGLPFADWLMDEARVAGDMTVSEQEDSGYYVVLFQNRDDNSYATVNVRHILIQAEDTDEDETYSDEELAAAKEEIERIYAEWQAGDQTEESFAALANEYSTDTGSNTNGGLYENVYKGQMVTEFNDFCFDPARQPGDVEIIEDTAYNGCHLMYYVGTGDLYQTVLARDALSTDAMSDFEESLTADLDYKICFAMRYAGAK